MTLLSRLLKDHTDTWSKELLSTSRLATLARSGRLSQRAMAVYLESIRYLLKCSERNLARAVARSRALGKSEIAAYFAHKVAEEHGHEQWARDDLGHIAAPARTGVAPASNLLALTSLQDELLDRHPICFVAYALWTEYFTATAGDEWLSALEHSGFCRTQVSAIAKHVEADRAHAQHGLIAIDRLWTGEPDADTIMAGVVEARRIFECFFDEVAQVAA